MLTEDALQQALAGVIDPLLGQNLVDLGMVHAVRLAPHGRAVVWLTLPSRDWPASDAVIQAAQAAIASLPGLASVDVRALDDPPWSPYRLAPALKAPLGLPAVEPPAPVLPAPPAASRIQRLLRRLPRL